MGVENLETKQDLANFIRQTVGLPQNLQGLLATVIDTNGTALKLRWGTASITGTGAASATVTVAHGLGKAPLVVVANAKASDTAGLTTLLVTTEATDATNLKLTARDSRETVWSSTQSIYWLALG